MKKKMENIKMENESLQEFPNLKPMCFKTSLLFFGVPSLIMFVGFHFVMPNLIRHGYTPFNAYFIGLGLPLLFMFIASIIAFREEGNEMNLSVLKNRFRLHQLSWKMWLLAIVITIITLILYGISIKLNSLLLSKDIILMPSSLPAWLDSSKGISMESLSQAFGGLSGNWFALIASFTFLIFNIIGEEFWWRGYILPRQELVFGKWTWVLHGFLWAFFHTFKWWDILSILPITLILTYMVWRFKNTTVGIVIHLIINGMGLIPIFLGILSHN